MRQKIWCDRWIVKFREKNFRTKHSPRIPGHLAYRLCFEPSLAVFFIAIYLPFAVLLSQFTHTWGLGLGACMPSMLPWGVYHVNICILLSREIPSHGPLYSLGGVWLDFIYSQRFELLELYRSQNSRGAGETLAAPREELLPLPFLSSEDFNFFLRLWELKSWISETTVRGLLSPISKISSLSLRFQDLSLGILGAKQSNPPKPP